ncbi:MAG: glycosyltransferase, partial [Proteobacteria bacterium]
MICILEPKTDQALSGNFLYNKELSAASHGKIERISLSKQDMDSFIQGDTLLIDSAWLYSAPAKALAKAEGNGWLVHSLPDRVGDWQKTFAESTHLVASSASVADRLRAEMPDHKIITLLPAVDTRIRSLHPQEREHDLLRLITVANVMPRKGLKEAAMFLRKVEEEEGLAFHWYVVGQPMPDREYNGSPEIDEAYVDEFTSLIDLYEWHDDVTLVGSFTMEQQIRMYLNMDVAFFPSLKEDFGKVLLETA